MRGREKEEIVEGLNTCSLAELPQFYLNANYSAQDERMLVETVLTVLDTWKSLHLWTFHTDTKPFGQSYIGKGEDRNAR